MHLMLVVCKCFYLISLCYLFSVRFRSGLTIFLRKNLNCKYTLNVGCMYVPLFDEVYVLCYSITFTFKPMELVRLPGSSSSVSR